MKKLLLVSVLLLLISLEFIAGESGEWLINEPGLDIQIFGEKETKPIKVCDKENATLLEKLTCADDVKGFYSRLILTELIIRQDNLIKELNETKNELENTKRELKNLEEIIGIRNGSQLIVGTNVLTGKSISEESKTEDSSQIKDESKTDKGILGFFRRIFNQFRH